MSAGRKSREEIKIMRYAGNVVALVHQAMKNEVKPGVSTKYLDEVAAKIIKENKCVPTFLGYGGFPATICTSVNDNVVHGIPSDDEILKEGDIISIDVGATYHGMVGDSAWTYPVGEISDDCKMLLETTEKALFAGIEKMRDGAILDEVSGAVEDVALSKGLGIVRQYGGHGVGHQMHEEPFVFNYRVGSKYLLKSGMTIAVEPMLNLGTDDVYVQEDKWTVTTKDHKPSAHFEHTIHVTDGEPDILTILS